MTALKTIPLSIARAALRSSFPRSGTWPRRWAPALADAAERAELVAVAREWGYFGHDGAKLRPDLWRGKHMLDIGMGAGPHSISYVEGGALSYTGVDPLIGSDTVRDFRSLRDRSYPDYHAFPFGAADIERLYPNIHLHSGVIEDLVPRLKGRRIDLAIMSMVTEHLENPHDVVRAIWEVLDRGGLLWLSHASYYAWTGHHRAPRSVEEWNQSDPAQNANADWRHLEPSHPSYSDDNLNRVRLDDLRALIEKYFEIVDWTVAVDAVPRLTPDIRRRWRRYSLEELLGRTVYIIGRRRDRPSDIDLSARQFHHPDETYLADRDYSAEEIAPYRDANSVFFAGRRQLRSHSTNDYAGRRLFQGLKRGDVITVRKFQGHLRLTVAGVKRRSNGLIFVRLAESVAPEIVARHEEWTLEPPRAARR